jgi:tRNA-splicing ligase RtcB (3'-phosphate/5'-hydroxy nucleic acid ligase)
LPFIKQQVVIMPDCHMGYGMPIGGVIACKDVVIPAAVGVDIGCGVLATKTDIQGITTDQVKTIMGKIRERVPVGFHWHEKPVAIPPIANKNLSVCYANYKKAELQVGSLGGGNHFIELQLDPEGYLWFMIHSGSRNLGKQVADHYDKLAREKNKGVVPDKWGLAFFTKDDLEFLLYLDEMHYCVSFAKFNRRTIAGLVMKSIGDIIPDVGYDYTLDVAHNYAQLEHVPGSGWLYVHRKGATEARQGNLGIIPGSQGSASYIVEGLGNDLSFNSCSHGAGRQMGRKQAQRTLNLADEIARLDQLGVVHGIRNQKDLDEATGAYKDIDQVMENQKDLVKIKTKLVPLGVIKG